MNIRDAYSSSYLSVERWPEDVTDGTIETAGLDDDNFSRTQGARQVYITLAGSDQRLRVNKTNALAMAEVLGDDLRQWPGSTIRYYKQQATIKGQRGWAGVIEAVAPRPAKPVSNKVNKTRK